MESRRANLLIKGYLAGRLDFKKKTQFSLLREEIIIREMEQESFASVFYLRSLMESSIAAGLIPGNPKAIKFPDASYERYFALALPYAHKQSKIKEKELLDADKDFFASIKKLAQENNGKHS